MFLKFPLVFQQPVPLRQIIYLIISHDIYVHMCVYQHKHGNAGAVFLTQIMGCWPYMNLEWLSGAHVPLLPWWCQEGVSSYFIK